MRFPATRRSSCTKTDSAGFTFRKVYRTGRCRRTMNRSSRRCTTPFTRATQIRWSIGLPARKIVSRRRVTALPICPHDLPADRASHRRRDVALPQPSRRIAAGIVRGDVARARARTEDRERRLHFDRQFARRNRIARTRESPHAAAALERKNCASNCDAVSFRLGRTGARRRDERSRSDFRRAQRHDHGSQGACLQHRPGPIAARTGFRRVDQEICAGRWPAESASGTAAAGRIRGRAAGGHGQHGKIDNR